MDCEQLRNFCLSLPLVTECFPFDEETLVFKVDGKMFLYTSLETIPFSITLKCEPDRALELRELYSEVQPGFHMNKKHWNTITCSPRLKDRQINEWILHAYTETVNKLPKNRREFLNSQLGACKLL